MKKVLYKNYYNELVMIGIKEEVLWKNTDYHRGPRDSGEYTVSNGDGKTFTLFCTGTQEYAEELFRSIMHEEFREGVTFKDSGAELTNDDLIGLYKSCGIWYDLVDGRSDGDGWCEQQLVIYRGDDIPKYFLDKDPSGPLVADAETYEGEITTELS